MLKKKPNPINPAGVEGAGEAPRRRRHRKQKVVQLSLYEQLRDSRYDYVGPDIAHIMRDEKSS